MAITAAKLIWKLGPTTASGQNRTTRKPAMVTIRIDKGSRPMARAARTSTAPMQDRIVGSSAPVSKV